MFDFAKDSSWTFVGVLVAIATFWIGWQSWRRKSLLYEVTSLVNILDIPKDFRNKLEVLFDSKPVEDLYLVTIKFFNSGNVPTEEDDFIREISINLGEKSKVLSVDILEQKTNDLGINPTIKNVSNNKQQTIDYKNFAKPQRSLYYQNTSY